MLKLYDDFDSIFTVEQVICEDIRQKGISHGWTGDFETFKVLKNKLAKQKVVYKYLGTWVKEEHSQAH